MSARMALIGLCLCIGAWGFLAGFFAGRAFTPSEPLRVEPFNARISGVQPGWPEGMGTAFSGDLPGGYSCGFEYFTGHRVLWHKRADGRCYMADIPQ